MNWKEFCSKKVPIMAKIKEAKHELSVLEQAYIDEHKQFEKGDHVIATGKKAIHTVVYGHKITESGKVVPVLLQLRKNRTSRPAFYHQHEIDESIVLEKYNENEQSGDMEGHSRI